MSNNNTTNMTKISEYLKEAGFIAIRPNSKKPLVGEGQDWNDSILNYNQACDEIDKGNNVAIVCGYNGFIMPDCDSDELYNAFTSIMYWTYEEKSISGMKHLIYRADWVTSLEDNQVLKAKDGKHLGEIRCCRQYVVIAPSKAKDEKKGIFDVRPYEITQDRPVISISKQDIANVLSLLGQKDIISQEKTSKGIKLDSHVLEQIRSDSELSKLFDGDISDFPSRSEAEASLVFKLVARGFDKETIFKIMANTKIDRWNESPLSYRNRTFEKAIALVTESKEGWENGKNTTIVNINQALNVMTLNDYRKYKIDKRYIIEGRIYKKYNEMRYAPSGFFKSIYSLYEAVCIASGRKLLNRFRVKKNPVLYVSAENAIETDKPIIEKICKGLKIKTSKLPFYVLPRQECEDIMSEQFQSKLARTIEEKGIKVIYLDTINPLTPALDDNKGKEVTQVFARFLKPIQDKYGCYICFLHHTTKQESSFLGSMKWKANADIVTRLERKGLLYFFKIYNEKNRRGESNTLEVKISFGEDKITFDLIAESSPEIFSKRKKMTQAEFFALKLNEFFKGRKREDITRNEIFEAFEENKIKFSRASLDRAIGEWRK